MSLPTRRCLYQPGDVLTNAGTLTGYVNLNGGNDRYLGSRDSVMLLPGQSGFGVDGASGADTLIGGAGDDLMTGGNHVDTLGGGAGDDTLNGGDWGDSPVGRAGKVVLNGEVGGDRLHGGAGRDTLTGGAGPDLFQFDRGDGIDGIADFTDGTDRIDLRSWGLIGFAELQTTFDLTQTADGVVFDFGEGDLRIVDGATIATLGNADFLF